MSRRVFLILFGLVIVASAGAYWVTRGRARGLVLTGIVTTDDVIVSSQISGRLSQVTVKEGDAVKRGQVVALVEPQALQADQAFYTHSEESATAQAQGAEAALKYQELQTRHQIQQAEAALAAMEAQQAEAAADLDRVRLDNERTKGLFQQGIASAQAYDAARTQYESSQAHLESLRKQVEAQRAALALARANAEQDVMRRSQWAAQRHQQAAAEAQKVGAGVRLSYTEIRAPIDGVVSARAARTGEVVNPGQPILTLINPDDLWVRADIEETYVDRIRLGDRMTVQLPSGAERMGKVFYRGVDADFATQRDVSRTKRDIKTFEIRLRVDNSDRRLSPGLTAYVIVPVEDVR